MHSLSSQEHGNVSGGSVSTACDFEVPVLLISRFVFQVRKGHPIVSLSEVKINISLLIAFLNFQEQAETERLKAARRSHARQVENPTPLRHCGAGENRQVTSLSQYLAAKHFLRGPNITSGHEKKKKRRCK